ncbi:uncharacterized protein LOC132697142 [Cylas formicarius]|uniref:uncharacterized protein LOC132697142 n=1 Tax=Cylas formicarius TaxID=197179 RepID=UPI002958B01C|nr:uncharacterized protein LOC132697142 [Cylas formicarius]
MSLARWVGKVAVVTGASSGIGEAIAKKLVENGVTVAALARRDDRLNSLAKQLTGEKGKLYPVKCDVREEESIISAFREVRENSGPVHILVNNAGLTQVTSLIDGDADKWRTIFDTNVMGLCIATREAVKDMKANKTDGHIIHINGTVGYKVLDIPKFNVYPASKYAVTALAETLRYELNGEGLKIKVTGIYPGLVQSEFAEKGLLGENQDPHLAEVLKVLPKIYPSDVADSVIYVLSTPPHVQVSQLRLFAVGDKNNLKLEIQAKEVKFEDLEACAEEYLPSNSYMPTTSQFLTVEGGCGNRNIVMAPKQLTRNQQFEGRNIYQTRCNTNLSLVSDPTKEKLILRPLGEVADPLYRLAFWYSLDAICSQRPSCGWFRHSQSKLYLDENGQLTKNVFLSEQFLLKRSCHKGSVYFIAQTSGKLLTVKGGCGNTVISLEPKRLTQNQRFDFLDGAHITSKCDPTSIVGLADNNETLAVKKNDPADYTKNRIGLVTLLFLDYFKDPFVISHSQSKQYLDENGRLTKNLFLTEKFLLKRFATKAVLILSRKQAAVNQNSSRIEQTGLNSVIVHIENYNFCLYGFLVSHTLLEIFKKIHVKLALTLDAMTSPTTTTKLLTVKGGCGNTVISLEPKQLTKKQRFGFLDGTHITSKCDPNSIVGSTHMLIFFFKMAYTLERWIGKVAVVTGASSGIGEAIARRLVSEGLIVVGLARRKERLESLEKQLKISKGTFHPVTCDISKEEDILNAFKYVKENLGYVHILINNAGIGVFTSLTSGDSAIWRRVFEVNVLGLCIATKEAYQQMAENGVNGHIIHINSILGHKVSAVSDVYNANVYPASKFAVKALAESLKMELSYLKKKIKITNLSPGRVKTEILEAGNFAKELVDTAYKGETLYPEDIAECVVFALTTPPHVNINELIVTEL